MMKLRREVPCRRPDRRYTIGATLVATIITATIAAMITLPRVFVPFGESKADIGRLTIKKYAYEAFPSWVAANPNATCPPSLRDLNAYMHTRDIIDPWGTPYRMYCGDHGIVVHSFGEDGIYGTTDDLWSHP